MLEQSTAVDRVFQALADPTRRQIVERLGQGPVSVTALAEPFPMSLAAVLQHVQALEWCGLVRTEKVGRVRTCQLEPATLAVAERWFSARRSAVERQLDRLGAFLAETDDTEATGSSINEESQT